MMLLLPTLNYLALVLIDLSYLLWKNAYGLNNTLTTKCLPSYKEFYIHKINCTNFIASNSKYN